MKFVWKLNNCLQLSNFALNSLLFVLCLVAGKRLGAQASTVLTVSDTRSGDSVPKAYKRVARFDFKYRGVIHAPGSGTYNGLFTLAPWSDASGGPSYQMSFDPSGIFLRQGNYTSDSWTTWSRFVIENNKGVTTLGNGDSASGLNVNGRIKAKMVNVTIADWADNVFDRDYSLPALKDLDLTIKEKGHLPDMPSAEEVLRNGIDVGEMNKKLLKKIK